MEGGKGTRAIGGYVVLILILMECSLGNKYRILDVDYLESLNPYSNGMLTWTNKAPIWHSIRRLNPYSNGMLTWNGKGTRAIGGYVGLNPYSNGMLTWIL